MTTADRSNVQKDKVEVSKYGDTIAVTAITTGLATLIAA